MTSYVLLTPNFYSIKYSDVKKAQPSIIVTPAIKAFMISKTGGFSILVRRLGVTTHTVSYKAT